MYREANRTVNYVASLGHQVQTHQDIDPYVDNKFSYFNSLDKLGHVLFTLLPLISGKHLFQEK